MKITLCINVLEVMQHNRKHPCQRKETPYKIASCFLGSLTEKIKRYFLRQAYRQLAVQSSLERATYIMKWGEQEVKITQVLVESPLVAQLLLEVNRDELAGTAALLKSLDIPRKSITFPH